MLETMKIAKQYNANEFASSRSIVTWTLHDYRFQNEPVLWNPAFPYIDNLIVEVGNFEPNTRDAAGTNLLC